MVVGNSRALWPAFAPRLEGNDEDDPLDRYTEAAISRALRGETVRDVVFAHATPPPPIQSIATQAANLWTAPCGMVIDAECGLWIALRAVIRTDEALDTTPGGRASPCEGCHAPCRRALDAALAGSPATLDGVRTHWRLWLRIREVCPVGPEHRYGEEQIAYHYRRERCSKK